MSHNHRRRTARPRPRQRGRSTFVFGLQCPEIDPFLAALEGNGIRFITIRHEAAAVHMAEGLYKTTGQVAAVLGNPGPRVPQTSSRVW